MFINILLLVGIIIFYFRNLVYTNKHYVHMLQLNSYKNERYIGWIQSTYRPYLPNIVLGLLLFTCVCIVIWTGIPFIYALIISFVCFFCASFQHIKIVEKKKFVITHRVIRLFVTEGLLVLLLFALATFCSIQAYHFLFLLCVAFLILLFQIKVLLPLLANYVNIPMEKQISNGYYKDAQRILAKNKDLVIIGITGSYGKTSTKYILSRILSVQYNVLMTPESYNTTLGVVRTIREQLQPIHEIFVVEMGAKKRNDIKEICDLVKPTYGCLSSIGPMHLETFGSIENVIQTKYELIDSLPEDGIAFLNVDNTYINQKRADKRYISYATQANQGADFWAEEIAYDSTGTRFVFCSAKGLRIPMKTKLLGAKNICNIVGACGIAITLGVKEDEISYTVGMLPPVPHRLELKFHSPDIAIIDDAYNANPEGAQEALQVLKSFSTAKKVLLTPGMVELGDKERHYNYEFGKQAAAVCDFIILVGEKRAVPIYEGIESAGYPKENCFIASNLQEAIQKMHEIAIGETVVLLENDLPDNFEA